MSVALRIAPCLWFADEAEQAAGLYTAVFPNSRVIAVTRYGEAGREHHRREPGSVMTVEFELDGQRFTALNGGRHFPFSEAISFQVFCDTQAEVDHYWEGLGEGGDPKARACGWLKDRFGVSWQVVPSVMDAWFMGGVTPATERVMQAMMPMKKLDIAALEAAYAGR